VPTLARQVEEAYRGKKGNKKQHAAVEAFIKNTSRQADCDEIPIARIPARRDPAMLIRRLILHSEHVELIRLLSPYV